MALRSGREYQRRMDDERPTDGPPVLKPEHLRRGGRRRPASETATDEVEVEGVVTAGVEHGSVVLTGADGRGWQLGRSHGHLVGCTVVVRGRPRDMMTTAQQGIPFAVLALEVVAGTPGRPGVAPDQV